MASQLADAWKILIRPSKCHYQKHDLGPESQVINSTKYIRHDFTYCNEKSFLLQCSLFYPEQVVFNDSTGSGGSNSFETNAWAGGNNNSDEAETKETLKFGFERLEKKPCLIYLHSQTGNRLEGLFLLNQCAKRRIALLLFDFAGCGLSDGEYVSLGYHEKNDLNGIINQTLKNYPVSSLSLWGRSMGAVTAILFCEKYTQYNITSMILDSPFNELATVVKEFASRNFNLPGILLTMAIKMISGMIEKKIGYDIFELNPGEAAEKIIIPALFICGKNDKLLPPKTVIAIYKAYKSKKKVLLNSDLDHNDEREPHLIDSAFSLVTDEFFKTVYNEIAAEDEIKEKGKIYDTQNQAYNRLSISNDTNDLRNQISQINNQSKNNLFKEDYQSMKDGIQHSGSIKNYNNPLLRRDLNREKNTSTRNPPLSESKHNTQRTQHLSESKHNLKRTPHLSESIHNTKRTPHLSESKGKQPPTTDKYYTPLQNDETKYEQITRISAKYSSKDREYSPVRYDSRHRSVKKSEPKNMNMNDKFFHNNSYQQPESSKISRIGDIEISAIEHNESNLNIVNYQVNNYFSSNPLKGMNNPLQGIDKPIINDKSISKEPKKRELSKILNKPKAFSPKNLFNSKNKQNDESHYNTISSSKMYPNEKIDKNVALADFNSNLYNSVDFGIKNNSPKKLNKTDNNSNTQNQFKGSPLKDKSTNVNQDLIQIFGSYDSNMDSKRYRNERNTFSKFENKKSYAKNIFSSEGSPYTLSHDVLATKTDTKRNDYSSIDVGNIQQAPTKSRSKIPTQIKRETSQDLNYKTNVESKSTYLNKSKNTSPLTNNIKKNPINYLKDIPKENVNNSAIRPFSVDVKENKSAIEFREKNTNVSKINLFKRNTSFVNAEIEKLHIKNKRESIATVPKKQPSHMENNPHQPISNMSAVQLDNKENSPEGYKISYKTNDADQHKIKALDKPQVCEFYDATLNNPVPTYPKNDSLNISFSNSHKKSNYNPSENISTTKTYLKNEYRNQNNSVKAQRMINLDPKRLSTSPDKRISLKADVNFHETVQNNQDNPRKLQNPLKQTIVTKHNNQKSVDIKPPAYSYDNPVQKTNPLKPNNNFQNASYESIYAEKYNNEYYNPTQLTNYGSNYVSRKQPSHMNVNNIKNSYKSSISNTHSTNIPSSNRVKSGVSILDTEVKNTSVERRYHHTSANLVPGSINNSQDMNKIINKSYDKYYTPNTNSINNNYNQNTPSNAILNSRAQGYNYIPPKHKLSLKSKNITYIG